MHRFGKRAVYGSGIRTVKATTLEEEGEEALPTGPAIVPVFSTQEDCRYGARIYHNREHIGTSFFKPGRNEWGCLEIAQWGKLPALVFEVCALQYRDGALV